MMLQVSLGSHQKCQPECACLRPKESLHTSARMFLRNQHLGPCHSGGTHCPTGAQVLTAVAPHSQCQQQTSASVDPGCVSLGYCHPAEASTWVCADKGTAPAWFGMPKDPEQYGIWAVFICLCHIKEKETGADVQILNTYHIQSHSLGLLAGPSVGKAVIPDFWFVFRVSVIYSLILLERGNCLKCSQYFLQKDHKIIWNQKSPGFT